MTPPPSGATAAAGPRRTTTAVAVADLGVDWGHLLVARGTLGPQGLGSNNWAVGPSRSASGRAMVANDPHLDNRILPGTWHPVGLFAPGIQAVGAALPGMPGILVGRTAQENEALLRGHTRGNDTWIHARDYAGAYVFIRAPSGKSIPLETLLDGATLALWYSKGRQSGRGDAYYTQVKYLRRPRGGKPGLVLPTQEKNLHVRLEPQRLRRLQEGSDLPPS